MNDEIMNKRQIGMTYEQRAADYLVHHGHRILARNYRCRFGEIDLVSEQNGTLVFSEVKFRSTARYGTPMQAVHPKKQKTISNVASFYLYRNGYSLQTPCRFDVIAVSEQEICVYENAFFYRGDFFC